MREPSKGGCDFGRTKCGWHIHNPVSLALRPGRSRTSQTRLRGCGEAGTGGFFEGVYQVDTCICLMYIFQEVYCLSACSNRFARSASKQSGEQNECGTPSLYLRLIHVNAMSTCCLCDTQTHTHQGVNPCSAYTPLDRFTYLNVIHSDSVVMTSACISLVKRQSGIQLQDFGLSTLQALGLRFVLGSGLSSEPVRQPCPAHLPNPHPQPHVGRQGGSPPWPGFPRAHFPQLICGRDR